MWFWVGNLPGSQKNKCKGPEHRAHLPPSSQRKAVHVGVRTGGAGPWDSEGSYEKGLEKRSSMKAHSACCT